MRRNFHLVCSERKVEKLVAKPTFKTFDIINNELSLIEMLRCKVTLNKPIYTGFCVLELSKLLMYEFHYKHIKKFYEGRAKLCFTDTDSLCYHIFTPDLYADMRKHIHFYDTSNFPDDERGLYSRENEKVVGKFKDECAGLAPRQFVGLRSKMYSLQVTRNDKKPKMTAKGISKNFVKNHLRHETYLHTLNNKVPTRAKYLNFRSKRCHLFTAKIDKICLSAFDNKRYILPDGISTLAYGHYRIKDLTGHQQ
jgi:hypothetical protein